MFFREKRDLTLEINQKSSRLFEFVKDQDGYFSKKILCEILEQNGLSFYDSRLARFRANLESLNDFGNFEKKGFIDRQTFISLIEDSVPFFEILFREKMAVREFQKFSREVQNLFSAQTGVSFHFCSVDGQG